MWQRFTEAARRAVFFAQEEAQKFGEGYVSTEHILLGLVREECVATRVIEALEVSINRVRSEVEKQLPRGDEPASQDMTLTPRAKRTIDLAYDEARALNNNYIGTEHLLLGLIREGDGLAGRVLEKLGVNLFRAREQVMNLQETPGGEDSGPPSGGGFLDHIKAKFGLSGDRTPREEERISYSDQFNMLGTVVREDAEERGIRIVGTHDWLWAILQDPELSAHRVLVRTGIDLDGLRARLKTIRAIPPMEVSTVTYSPMAKNIERRAVQLARELRSASITTAHALLAISHNEHQGLAASLLEEAGIYYEHLYVLAAQMGDEE